MNTIDKTFVEERLRNIELYAERMQKILERSDDEINKDFLLLHSLERLIQLIVDEMLDVNTHIIQYAPLKAPDDFQSTFLALAQSDILPKDFAECLAPSVGLRNRLVHRYERVNIELLISMARKEHSNFNEYRAHISAYLDTIKSNL